LELHNAIPEYFLVVDSGAQVHVLFDTLMLAHIEDGKQRMIKWGGEGKFGRCTHVGWLCGVTQVRDRNGKWSKRLLCSGTNDAWAVPETSRQLYSTRAADRQGHLVTVTGPNPGQQIHGTGEFIPFVRDDDTGYQFFPLLPPPSRSNLLGSHAYSSMPVLNLNASVDEGSFLFSAYGASLSQRRISKKRLLKRKRNQTLDALLRKKTDELKSKRATDKACARIRASARRHSSPSIKGKDKFSQAKLKAYTEFHEKCGHVNMKDVIKFKRTGKLVATNLPTSLVKDYKKNCAICLASRRRKPARPDAASAASKGKFKPWEKVHCDSTGKRKVASSRGNRYFTVFVCASTGRKLFFPHKNRKQFAVVYMEFVSKIGSHPRILITDKGGEWIKDKLARLFIINGVQHVTIPKGEHFLNGPAEKAIQDINNMIRAYVVDSNVPYKYWDFIGEHACYVNAMIRASPANPEMTIFEAETGRIPNLDIVPPIGCFCVRIQDRSSRADQQLDPANQPGVFLGFATLNRTFGSIILAEKAVVVAKNNVAYDYALKPYQLKDANPSMRHLQQLLGRSQIRSNSKSTTAGEFDDAMKQLAEHYFEPDQHDPQEIADTDEASDEDSDDDPEVDTLLDHALNSTSAPPYNPLAARPSTSIPETEILVDEAQADSMDTERQQPPSDPDTAPRTRSSSRVTRKPLPVFATLGRHDFNRQFKKEVEKATKKLYARSAATATLSKRSAAPEFTSNQLLKNKNVLVGKRVKRFIPGRGGVIGKVLRYSFERDAYLLSYGNGEHEVLTFDDMLRLLPKSWKRREAEANLASLHAHMAAAANDAHYATSPPPPSPTSFTEPRTEAQARKAPDSAQWISAMDTEYRLLNDVMKCWEVVNTSDLPKGANLIGCKWTYKLKFRNGVYDKHRARIVALGYQQRKDVDYFASFSPTASHVTIRLILSLTALPGFRSVDLDATCAFISAPLPKDEQVYMKAVPGYPLKEGQCLKLRSTIYGLVQSPRAYYKLCQEVYSKCGLRQLKSDECVFVRYANNIKGAPDLTTDDLLERGAFETMETVPPEQRIYPSCPHPVAIMILAMYVDNNGIRHNCDELVEEFEAKVKQDGRIKLNREGGMEWFLGVRYSFNSKTGEVTADQEAYIDSLLDKHGLTDCNPTKVPMQPNVDLSALPLPPKPDADTVRAYAMLVGELMYVAVNTVPSIAYAVSCLARYMTNATAAHYAHAKQVLRYLKGVKSRKIRWCAANVRYPLKACEICAFADSSWADDKPSRKSTYSYMLFCNNAAFSWKSSLAPILALSTSEAELIAVCACAQEVIYCRKLATELGFLQVAPTRVYEDNHGAICLAENGHFKGRTKHVHLRWGFVSDCIDQRVIRLVPCPSADQIADSGTAARAYPALKVADAAIYGGLASHASMTA
jgi:hypothetical protein